MKREEAEVPEGAPPHEAGDEELGRFFAGLAVGIPASLPLWALGWVLLGAPPLRALVEAFGALLALVGGAVAVGAAFEATEGRRLFRRRREDRFRFCAMEDCDQEPVGGPHCEGHARELRDARCQVSRRGEVMKVHIMRFAPQDYRTSRVRSRSAMTADPILRLVYLEALLALHENGGELPSDPEALADELLLPATDIARCLPLLDALARRPGSRGGLLVEDGKVRNLRVSEDLGKTQAWLAGQAESGRQSAAVRRARHGSAQPRGRSADPEGGGDDAEAPPNEPSSGPEATKKEPEGSPEPAVAVASAIAKPENNAPPGPPGPVENPGPTNGARRYRVGDELPDGREVLEVDENGGLAVVSRPPAKGPGDGLSAAVARLVAAGARFGYRFDRGERRELRERLASGETEAQVLARWESTERRLEALDALESEADLAQALRLAGQAS